MDPRPVSGNSASPGEVRKAKTRESLRRRRQLDDLRAVLELPGGRRVLWRLLEQTGIYRGGFSGDRAHFNEGQRNIGLFLIAELEAAKPNALESLRAQRDEDTRKES